MRERRFADSTLHPIPTRADTCCVDTPQLKSAYLLPPVIAGLYLVHTAWSWALAGGIALVVGTLVALDYRGVAARIPPVLGFTQLSWNRSVGARRRTFAFVALWGVLMVFLALGR
jgi:amino acid permease